MWYVIQTMSGNERKCMQDCQQKLKTDEYQSMFIPQFIGKKHFQKEWHDVKKILFNGYFFVDAQPEQIDELFHSLKNVQHLTKLLKDADQISPITEQEQEFLQDMMDEEHIVRYSLGFMIGEKVYITEGPLRKRSGMIRSVDRHRRIAMLDVDFFGRQTPVEVGFGAVARVTEEQFEDIRQENIWRYQKKKRPVTAQSRKAVLPAGLVQVRSGVFEGMTGRFLSANPAKNEWNVEMEVFDMPMRVVFRREELEM